MGVFCGMLIIVYGLLLPAVVRLLVLNFVYRVFVSS